MNNKSRLLSLFALAMIGLSLPASAQYYKRAGGSSKAGDSFHFAYVSGGVGYSSLDCQIPEISPTGGVGGFAGLGYEFRNSGFWLSIGAQFSIHHSEVNIENFKFQVPDEEGKYRFNCYDKYGNEVSKYLYNVQEHDIQDWQFIDIPVLVGWYFHGFHIGIGPKLSYSINSKVSSKGTYDLAATYTKYGDIVFENMSDLGYKKYDFEYDKKATLTPMVSLIGEIGYDILSAVPTRSQLCHLFRVSFYFEYGLNSIVNPVSSNTRFDWEKVSGTSVYDATKLIVNPYFASGMTESYRVVPFFTGVKFTYLFGGSKHSRAGGFHKGCQCYN